MIYREKEVFVFLKRYEARARFLEGELKHLFGNN